MKKYGMWRYSSTIIWHYMKRSDLFQAVVPLAPGKESALPIEQEAGWAPEKVWALFRRARHLPAIGNRTLANEPVDRRYTDELSQLPLKLLHLL
jgi:hypothetical protein